ncbi:MAG TPA: ATP-binding protein [Planctomycetota bacterium]|nr:ATP-binding protein [Planctomycetota bacterium]
MKSIRARVLLGGVVAMALTSTVLAALFFHTARKQIVYHFDDELRTHAGTLASIVNLEGGQLVFALDDATLPFYRSSPKAEYFEVRRDDGQVIGRSASLRDSHLPTECGTPEAPHIADLRLPGGHAGRVIGVRYELDGNAIRIAVAEPRHRLDESLERLIQSSALTAVGLGLATVALLWLVLRIGLRPLAALSTRVAELDPQQLPESLSLRVVPTELAPVVACLDDLLVRMRRSIERERRVAANIAHELRTPVAELQTVTDVALRWPDDVDYLRRSAAATHDISQRMAILIQKVLELATAGGSSTALDAAPTDLAALLRKVTAALRPRAAARSIALTEDIPGTVEAVTDAVALQVALDNLAQNAVEHAPPGSNVHFSLDTADGGAFTFRNEAPELDPADLPKLTEPYWRKDAARSPSGHVHAGIGLALAQELVRRLGGELVFSLSGGFLSATLRMRSRCDRSGFP